MEAVIKELMGLVTRHGDQRAKAGYADALCDDEVLACNAIGAKSTEAEIENRLRTALQSSGCVQIVPHGWKLVPELPSEEMVKAGYAAYGMGGCYQAMLGTAPQPPK